MNDSDTNYVDEAKRILDIIDEYELNEKEMVFISNIRGRVLRGSMVTQKQIFWLRDIKDKQLG